ncbi:uncharacterized protein LOC117932248 isoform X2 [Vitis riparia]|uniref:uncharacterized protein LOC117932248 isoform X2 n=1 Tax=Vitis riparia TaxID=96939 RepID=UPI00155A30D1|nr:uncharacterized protein LOC117932248 isoform X2 [Vitis riparia]
MASLSSPLTRCYYRNYTIFYNASTLPRLILFQQNNTDKRTHQISRREIILRSSEIAVLGGIFKFSGEKPDYLGVQKNTLSLSLCPATNNCISTSENSSDLIHYTPPWNYNPEGRRRGKAVRREEAMEELLQVIVDDVEFWFPPGKKPIVEYRSASRLGNFDFEVNRKRIKALRLELEKKGWASEDSI